LALASFLHDTARDSSIQLWRGWKKLEVANGGVCDRCDCRCRDVLAIGIELELEELELELELVLWLGFDVGRMGTWFGNGVEC